MKVSDTGRQTLSKEYKKSHEYLVYSLAIPSNGKLLFTADIDSVAKHWDLTIHTLIKNYGLVHKGRTQVLFINSDQNNDFFT